MYFTAYGGFVHSALSCVSLILLTRISNLQKLIITAAAENKDQFPSVDVSQLTAGRVTDTTT